MLRYRRHPILLSTAALFIVLRAYPQDLVQSTAPHKTWQLAGKVIDSVTRKPVSRALVRLTESSRAMLTGPEGDFFFDDVPSGKVDIQVA